MKTKMYDLVGAGGSKDIYIRIERVLELSQTVLVLYPVGMMLGVMLDRVFQISSEESHAKLWTMALPDLLKRYDHILHGKLINLVPFLFHFTTNTLQVKIDMVRLENPLRCLLCFSPLRTTCWLGDEIKNRFNEDIYPKKRSKKVDSFS